MDNKKINAILDRAAEQSNQRTTSIQNGTFHPRVDVASQGRPIGTGTVSPS